MKKSNSIIILAVFAIGLSANHLSAQGAYLSLHGGYALNMSAQNLAYFDYYNFTSGNTSSTVEQVYVSLGKGINVGGALGYMFNKNVGAELGVSYLLGAKTKAKDKYTDGLTNYAFSSKMLRINPSIVVAAGFEKVNPYASFGLVVGSGSILYEYEDNDDGDLYEYDVKFNGGMALGLSASLGVLLNLSENISFFGELNTFNLSYAPTKGEVTKALDNGVDELTDYTVSEKEIEFVDSYTTDENNPPPDSEPSKELKQRFPYGSFGLNIGIRIGF